MGKVFACSDLHGRLDLFNEICKNLQPDDTVYFLGDAADRGPDGWEVIKAIFQDKRWIYMKGNHEDLLVNAAKEYFKYNFYGYNFSLLCCNGGEQTFYGLSHEEDKIKWVKMIENLPTSKFFVNEKGQYIFLSHAGYTPNMGTLDSELLIWDREHIKDKWQHDNIKDDFYIIHGHTPIQYMTEDYDLINEKNTTAFWYFNGHKVNIDNGACWTNKVILLDLNTLEETIISCD